MSTLVVTLWGPPEAASSSGPLAVSLRRQTRSAWRLDRGAEPDLKADDITMCLPANTTLHSQACAEILDAFADNPRAAALFGDLFIDGRRQARPAWSPTRVQSEPGAALPLAVRADAPQFESGLDPWELESRLAESNANVLHLPRVLTSHPAPLPPRPSHEPADPRFESGERPGTRRRLGAPHLVSRVSVVIPSAGFALHRSGTPMLARCLSTLDRLATRPLEVIVVVGDEFVGDPAAFRCAAPLRIVHRGPGRFDFARAINCGLLASRGEMVLLLNDDIEAETSDWLSRMASHLEDPTVGAVGAALLYPDRTVQHVGTLIDDARPLNPFVGQSLPQTSAHGGDVARDVIAVVAACLLPRRADLLAVGGMSPELPVSCGDTDLCLRLRRAGWRVVAEPAPTLIHHESASHEPRIERWEWDRFVHRWGEVVDPWYHPAFRRPDDPECLNLNADHLEPLEADRGWPARDTRIRSRMHRGRRGRPQARAGT